MSTYLAYDLALFIACARGVKRNYDSMAYGLYVVLSRLELEIKAYETSVIAFSP